MTHYDDGHTDITTDEMQQIESDMQLAQLIQEEWDGDNLNETNPESTDALWKELDMLNISDEDLTKEERAILDEVRANCLSHTDFIIENGYPGEITIDHVEEIVNSLKVSFVNRRYFYMNEFKIGLNAYGLGDLISSHPDICNPFTLEEFHDETVPDGGFLFTLLKPKYSPESTTKRVIEESMTDHLQDLLISF